MGAYKEKSTIDLTLFTYTNLKKREVGIDIFSTLSQLVPDITPDKVDLGRGWQTVNTLNYIDILKPWPFVDNILFQKKKPFEVEIPVMQGDRTLGPKFLTYSIEEDFYRDPNNVNRFIDVSVELYKILKPDYGLIHPVKNKIEKMTIIDPKLGRTILPVDLRKGLPGIYWANFFSPKYLVDLGREKLLQSSSYKKIELFDGGLLIILSPTPFQFSITEDMQIEKEWVDFLGKNHFMTI